MNTEAIRAKFEKGFKDTEDGWVLDPVYSSFDGEKYVVVKNGGFHIVALLNRAFEGYQQAAKDMEAEITYLKEHHSITESAIGLTHLFLLDGKLEKATTEIEKCQKDLDDARGRS